MCLSFFCHSTLNYILSTLKQYKGNIKNMEKNTNIYKIYKHITVRQRDDLVYLAGHYPSLADVSRPNYTVRAQDSNGVVSDFG